MYAGRGSYFTLFSGILTAFRLYRLGNLCTVQCALVTGNIDAAGILGNSVKYSRKRATSLKFLGALQLAGAILVL